ncbi:40S ribosomal protein S13-like [Cucumis melo var. makuwa]|uniref:40S ribosomal protein S13-like n=1 Tax=Cucumis melo var. makuwa TaxID=1194695 RepID=A0A5A7TVS2_CUCMM|nr:40S ribosomal protein S13-like [Cucumis melo var. makuwa]
MQLCNSGGEDIVCIGVILRDSHGTAEVKSVTGNKILRILKAHGLAPERCADILGVYYWFAMDGELGIIVCIE